jgi:hypothetical protein
VGLNVKRERQFLKEINLSDNRGSRVTVFFFDDVVLCCTTSKLNPLDWSKLFVRNVVWLDKCDMRDLPDLPKEKNMFELVSTDERKDVIRFYLESAEEKKEVFPLNFQKWIKY